MSVKVLCFTFCLVLLYKIATRFIYLLKPLIVFFLKNFSNIRFIIFWPINSILYNLSLFFLTLHHSIKTNALIFWLNKKIRLLPFSLNFIPKFDGTFGTSFSILSAPTYRSLAYSLYKLKFDPTDFNLNKAWLTRIYSNRNDFPYDLWLILYQFGGLSLVRHCRFYYPFTLSKIYKFFNFFDPFNLYRRFKQLVAKKLYRIVKLDEFATTEILSLHRPITSKTGRVLFHFFVKKALRTKTKKKNFKSLFEAPSSIVHSAMLSELESDFENQPEPAELEEKKFALSYAKGMILDIGAQLRLIFGLNKIFIPKKEFQQFPSKKDRVRFQLPSRLTISERSPRSMKKKYRRLFSKLPDEFDGNKIVFLKFLLRFYLISKKIDKFTYYRLLNFIQSDPVFIISIIGKDFYSTEQKEPTNLITLKKAFYLLKLTISIWWFRSGYSSVAEQWPLKSKTMVRIHLPQFASFMYLPLAFFRQMVQWLRR